MRLYRVTIGVSDTHAMSFLIFFNLGSLCHVHEKNTLHKDDAHPEK